MELDSIILSEVSQAQKTKTILIVKCPLEWGRQESYMTIPVWEDNSVIE
jgi:hypothetical protein